MWIISLITMQSGSLFFLERSPGELFERGDEKGVNSEKL